MYDMGKNNDFPIEDWECIEYEEGEKAAWRNLNNHTNLVVMWDEEFDGWIVTGENSVLYGHNEDIEDFEEAVGLAKEYMRDTKTPSSMV
jgi:hypothetical protein